MVDYKKVCHLQPGEYFQMHQEDEPRNTIAINRTVREIFLKPLWNLQGGNFFEILLKGKHLRRSHCTPVNMTEYFIERYENFNTKGCPGDLIFGDFINQPIPSTYSDLRNDYADDGTPIDSALAKN